MNPRLCWIEKNSVFIGPGQQNLEIFSLVINCDKNPKNAVIQMDDFEKTVGILEEMKSKINSRDGPRKNLSLIFESGRKMVENFMRGDYKNWAFGTIV